MTEHDETVNDEGRHVITSALQFDRAPAAMNEEEFVQVFGGVYEHSPWIAAATWQGGLDQTHDTVGGLAKALAATVDTSDREQRRDLINAHPDLAGRAAVAGELTPESTAEQASAGIDQCDADEFRRFQNFNERYKRKFGLTFVMAVKGSDRHKILQAFEQRLRNEIAVEFDRAIQEIHKIAHLRLAAMAAHGCGDPTGDENDAH